MAITQRGERLTIVLCGKRNAGKSSLINALANQDIAIVSSHPGTTTDPVRKAYELLPIGPVTFVDTAGIDDIGELGKLRVKKTYNALEKADIAILVTTPNTFDNFDKKIIEFLKLHSIPYILVFNKIDIEPIDKIKNLNLNYMPISTHKLQGIEELKKSLKNIANKFKQEKKSLTGDFIKAGNMIVLVVPIDLAAPAGRLILPQVQTIRDILDNDAFSVIVKERELEVCLRNLKKKPDLIITDSQVILKVIGDIPFDYKVTTFSTIFARYKGDINILVEGANAIDNLENGDNILIAEACSHHIQSDDIGRVKIPRWLLQYTGKNLSFDVCSGLNYPEDLEKYKLIIHCGGCMITNREYMVRIKKATKSNIPITNYGICISKVQGVLDRILEPFPEF